MVATLMNGVLVGGHKDDFVHPELVCSELGVVYNGGTETWDRNTVLLRLHKSSIFSKRTCTIANILREYDLIDPILSLTIALLFEHYTFGKEKSGWIPLIDCLKLFEIYDLSTYFVDDETNDKFQFERGLFKQYEEFCQFAAREYNLASPSSKFNSFSNFIQLIHNIKSNMIFIDSFNEFGLIPFVKELTNTTENITPDTYYTSVFITIKEVCFICGDLDCHCQLENDDGSDDDDEEDDDEVEEEIQSIKDFIKQEELQDEMDQDVNSENSGSEFETTMGDGREIEENSDDEDEEEEDEEEEDKYVDCIKILASNEILPNERILMAINENLEDSLAICPVRYDCQEIGESHEEFSELTDNEDENTSTRHKKRKIAANDDDEDDDDDEYYFTADGRISNKLLLQCFKTMKNDESKLNFISDVDNTLLMLYQIDSKLRATLKNRVKDVLLFNLKKKDLFSVEQYMILQKAFYDLYN